MASTHDSRPKTSTPSVAQRRKASADVHQPTPNASSTITMSVKVRPTVREMRSVAPLSRSRLPRKSIPSRPRTAGTKAMQMMNPMTGNRIRILRETTRGAWTRMRRSAGVVSSLATGVTSTGTALAQT